jgi:hypothetical protein
MANITLSIPNEIHKQMKHFSEVKWSEIARKAIVEKLELLQLADKLASQSKLTEEDVAAFNKKIKASATKRFLG